MCSKIHRDDKQIILFRIFQLVRPAAEETQAAQDSARLAERKQAEANRLIHDAVCAAKRQGVAPGVHLTLERRDDGVGAVLGDDGVFADEVVIGVGVGGDVVPRVLGGVGGVQLLGRDGEPVVVPVFPPGGVIPVGVVPREVEGVDRAVELGEVPGVRQALSILHGGARDGAGGDARAIQEKGERVRDAAADGAALADGGICRLIIPLRPKT